MHQEELTIARPWICGTLPKGYKAAGIHCGVKRLKKDLALIVSEVPASAAAVFTLNRVQAAPVVLSRRHFEAGKSFRAIAVNSGNANACTGDVGYADASAMAEATARALGVNSSEVLVASTGVIGERLPVARVLEGIQSAALALSEEGFSSAATAIMTTDTFPKTSSASIEIEGRTVNITGMAKGSGMIHPNMATMLAFITTDAAIQPEVFQPLFKECVDQTFNRIVVDGDTSTNDMAVALANGEAGISPIQPGTPAYGLFTTELRRVMTSLASDIVRDGEGATKFIEINVEGAASESDALRAAKCVALSPLVKTAIHGEDANWGRIIAAVGYSGIEFDPSQTEIIINNTQILRRNYVVPIATREANDSLKPNNIYLHLKLNSGSGRAICWTCDLSEEYIVINGSYRS